MTGAQATVAPRSVPLPYVPSRGVRARALVASEWTKFWSVRSTYWTLLVMIITPIALGGLVAFILTHAARPPSGSPADPLLPAFVSLNYAALAVCVLGVLQFSSEYSTGLIRTTFTAVPRRRAVLAAKGTVLGGITLVAGEIVAFVSFFLDQAIMHTRHQGVSLSTPGVPGAVAANGVVLFALAMMALAIGAIIRHTAGGISAAVAVIVLPITLALLPAPWGNRIARFTLIDAAQQVSVLHASTNLFSPTFSMVVLLAWPAIALIIATVIVTRSPT